MYEKEKLTFRDKTFVYTYPPHLKSDCDWHRYYIEIIDRIFDDIKNKSIIEIPLYPICSDIARNELLFETGSYWEGALHYLRKVFLLNDREFLKHLKKIESLKIDDVDLKTFVFLSIWNSHGQLKWLKAYLIRCDSSNAFNRQAFDKAAIRNMYEIAIGKDNEDLLWLAKFIESHLDEGRKYHNPFFGGSNPLHLMYESR